MNPKVKVRIECSVSTEGFEDMEHMLNYLKQNNGVLLEWCAGADELKIFVDDLEIDE